MEDWYKVTSKEFKENGGHYLISNLYKSPAKLVMEIWNDHKWLPWKFVKTPVGYWDKRESQLQFLEYLGKELGYAKTEDWYGVSLKDITDFGGVTLLSLFNKSPSSLIMSVMNHHDWQPWKFKNKSHSFSSSLNSNTELKKYISFLAGEMQIQTLSDWYRVSIPQLEEFGPTSFLKKIGLHDALQRVYPDHKWEHSKFQLATQYWLKIVLKKYLPGVEMHENYSLPLHFDDSGRPITADVFIPSLSMAIEYPNKFTYLN